MRYGERDQQDQEQDQTLSKLLGVDADVGGGARRPIGCCCQVAEKLNARELLAAGKRATPAICSCFTSRLYDDPTTNPQPWPPNSRTPQPTSTIATPANSDYRVQSERAYQKQVRPTSESANPMLSRC